MTAMARTPVFPEATSIGALSAQLRRPRRRSATCALRRFETSPSRKERAVAGGLTNVTNRALCFRSHSLRYGRRAQIAAVRRRCDGSRWAPAMESYFVEKTPFVGDRDMRERRLSAGQSRTSPPHVATTGAGKGMSFASFRRFWAVAANRNSSFAPLGPRRRNRSSPRMRFR
jgi:hypothetical protein